MVQMIVKILTMLPVSPQNDARSLGIIAGNIETNEGKNEDRNAAGKR
jgi:hypothetical protein